MRKLLTALGIAVALAVSAVAGSAEAKKLKVGFVYVGPIGDHGWTYQHDQGRIKMEKHFADKVETTYVESVSEGADAERVIRQLAASGHDVIYTTSFGYMNATNKVAKSYPKIIFEHATGYKRAKNVGTYLSVTYEGRYISGFIAGSMAKSGKVGYIASFPIPEVIRDINAVKLGMERANPEAELKIVWVSTWYDPGKERSAAEVLMDQGVDVIIQHTDSPAAMQATDARGKYAVGQASDMSHFGPKSHLHSVVNDWSVHYINSMQQILDGTWKSRDYWGGMKDGVIVIPEFSKQIPEVTRQKALAMIEGIKDGTGHPFSGPIHDQSGKLRVPKGKHMTNAELATMNWYVKGIQGSIPK